MPEAKAVTDAQGRRIVLRELDPADMLDLIEAAGEVASNPVWVRNAMVMASIAEFDGVPVPMPADKAQIKALGRRIGNDGWAAAAKAVWGLADDPPADAPPAGVPAAPPPDPVGDIAKNS